MTRIPLAEEVADPACTGVVTSVAEAAAEMTSIAARWRVGPRPPRSPMAMRPPATGEG